MRYYKTTKKDRLVWFIRTRFNYWTHAELNGFKFCFPEYAKDASLKAKCEATVRYCEGFHATLEKMEFTKLKKMCLGILAKEHNRKAA